MGQFNTHLGSPQAKNKAYHMTHDLDSSALAEVMEQVSEPGMHGPIEAMTILLSEAIKIEGS